MSSRSASACTVAVRRGATQRTRLSIAHTIMSFSSQGGGSPLCGCVGSSLGIAGKKIATPPTSDDMQPRPTTSTGGRKGTTSSLDQETLYSIHKVLLGAEQREFPDTWKGGFAFREGERALRCGLWQREGGPCGVLAAVQAYVLRGIYVAGAPVAPQDITCEAAGSLSVPSPT